MIKKALTIVTVFALSLVVPNLAAKAEQNSNRKNILVLELKDGPVYIKLRPDLAPNHVARIKQLTNEGAYDHVVFHRVIDGFMAQTGDVEFGKKDNPNYSITRAGTGGSKYPNLQSEFSNTDFVRGTVGMARSSDPDSANSQFFICFDAAPYLNNQYTVVGEVVTGMDKVDKIKKGNTAQNGSVKDPDEILKAYLIN